MPRCRVTPGTQGQRESTLSRFRISHHGSAEAHLGAELLKLSGLLLHYIPACTAAYLICGICKLPGHMPAAAEHALQQLSHAVSTVAPSQRLADFTHT